MKSHSMTLHLSVNEMNSFKLKYFTIELKIIHILQKKISYVTALEGQT